MRSASAREEGAVVIAMQGDVEHMGVIIEHGLGAIAVMHVLQPTLLHVNCCTTNQYNKHVQRIMSTMYIVANYVSQQYTQQVMPITK